jgi:hypothetical protein
LEIQQEQQCLQNNHEHVDGHPLLAELEDVAKEGAFDCLQLTEWARIYHLLLVF